MASPNDTLFSTVTKDRLKRKFGVEGSLTADDIAYDATNSIADKVNGVISSTATKTYVDAQDSLLQGLINTNSLDINVLQNGKVDKETGKGLSTEDYTTIEKNKLATLEIVSILNGVGINVTGSYPNFTVTNSSPDQVVALTAGANISITGTYPNFTITSTGGGAVDSVNGQTGVVILNYTDVGAAAALGIDDNYVTDAEKVVIGNTSNTNTGDETNSTIKTKLGTSSTSTDGYLTSTDWNTFNNKQSAIGFTPENVANKVTSISSSSTDTQYISAKAAYDLSELKATQNVGICAETPITEANISIDYSTRVLTITPPLGYFHYFTDGGGVVVKHIVTGVTSFPAFTDTSGPWYFHFDGSGNPIVTQTPWTDFTSIAPIYRILWNATLVGSAKSVVEGLETHLNTISAEDHQWKHKYGTIWFSGADSISNAISSGAPNINGSNSVVSITTGTFIDDNLPYTITNSTGGLQFQQDLGNISAGSLVATNSAQMQVRYQDGAGLNYVLPATRFPFPWDIATNRPEYITSIGTRTLITSGNFFVTYSYSFSDPRGGSCIKIVTAPSSFNNLSLAQANTWDSIKAIYPLLTDNEIRPLYKYIFEYRSSYNVGCKYSALRQVDDLRKTIVTQTTTSVGTILASSVVYTPTGTVAATDVQSAITELDTEKVPTTRLLTINGTALDLSADRSWTVSGLSWGSAINGATGTGIAQTMSNSYAASGIGQSITIGNTQTQALTGLKIDLGTSTQGHIGLLVNAQGVSTSQRGIKIDLGGIQNVVGMEIANAGTGSALIMNNNNLFDVITFLKTPVTAGNANFFNAVSDYPLAFGVGAGNRNSDYAIIDFKRRVNTASTSTDNFNVSYIKRTSLTAVASSVMNAAGSVLKLENIATQTAGTLTDTVSVLTLSQAALSTGFLINGGTGSFQVSAKGRIAPRVTTEATNTATAINSDTTDVFTITALATADTIGAPTGTPIDGQKLTIRIKDNGTARALTWNAIFRIVGVTLPTTTVLGKTLYVGCVYNTADTKWDVLAISQEA